MIWKTHRISIFLKPFFGAQWLLPFFDVCRTSTGLRMPRAAVGETQFSWFNGNKTDTKLKAGLVSVVSCRKVWGHLPIAPLMSTRSTPPPQLKSRKQWKSPPFPSSFYRKKYTIPSCVFSITFYTYHTPVSKLGTLKFRSFLFWGGDLGGS